jgi:hypothetical protein
LAKGVVGRREHGERTRALQGRHQVGRLHRGDEGAEIRRGRGIGDDVLAGIHRGATHAGVGRGGGIVSSGIGAAGVSTVAAGSAGGGVSGELQAASASAVAMAIGRVRCCFIGVLLG